MGLSRRRIPKANFTLQKVQPNMTPSIQFTEADRDERGFIKTRPLSDLLPNAAPDTAPAHDRRAAWSTAAAFMLGLLILIAYTLASNALTPAPPVMRPTHIPATTSPAPTSAPIAHVPVSFTARSFVAYASPSGDVLGAIESTRAMTATAHYGSEWIQVDAAGSGLVWLRASDAPDMAISGPDLRPLPTAGAAPVVAEQAPPPPCASAGIPGKMVQVCGYGDLDSQARDTWIATYGGHVGSGDVTPTPGWTND